MRAYHFTSTKYALDNLKNSRLKIATIGDLNDPFELLGMDLHSKDARYAFRSWRDQMAGDYGMLCFSRNWRNPVLWSHYAEKHSGICLGFDISDELVQNVIYSSTRVEFTQSVLDDEANAEKFMSQLISTKFTDWAYEDEVRVFVDLNEKDQDVDCYFADFSETLVLREVIVGPLCKVRESELRTIVPDTSVKLIKTRLAFRSYRIVRDKRGFRSD